MKSFDEMGMEPDNATVVIELVVEVRADGVWSPNTVIEKVVSQTVREAETRLINVISDARGMRLLRTNGFRVVVPGKKRP